MGASPRSLIGIVAAWLLVAAAPCGSQPSPDNFDTLLATYRLDEAAALAREQLGDLEARGRGDTPAAADAIERLLRVFMLQDSGKDQAAALSARAVRIREQAGDEEALVATLITDVQVCELLDDMAKEGLGKATRAVALADRVLGPDHPRTLEARSWQGMALYRESRYDEAIALLKEVAARQEQELPDSLALARTLHTLALVYGTTRNYWPSIELAQRALEIRERAGAELSVGNSTRFLGAQYAEGGDYARAREFMNRSIAIRTRLLGPNVSLIGETLGSMAELEELMGDAAAAAASYERSIELQGPTWRGAVTCARYGNMLTELGDLEKARPLFERAIAMADAGRITSSPAFGVIHGDYANWLYRSGNLAEAKRHGQIALTMRERTKLPLGLGASLTQMARFAVDEGDVVQAQQLYERALAVHERMWSDHPMTNETRGSYAAVLARLGQVDKAQALALKATDGSLSLIRLALRGLPERQAVQYATALRRNLELSLTLLEKTGGDARPAFERVVKARAVVLDEIGRRQQAAPRSSEALTALARARERLARLTVRGSQAVGAEAFAGLMASARLEAERAEEALAAASPQFRDAREDERIGLTEIEGRLAEGTAFVAFVRYGDATAKQPTARYGAFVAAKNREPVFVPLGAAGPIDAAVTATRSELLREATAGGRGGRRTLASYRAQAAKLRVLAWEPVSRHIGGATQLMIVPDGTLNLVSFGALPVGDERYLVETAPPLHYLAAERDVVRRVAAAGQGLLAVGSPRFGGGVSGGAARGARLRSALASPPGCADLSSLRFTPLEGASREVDTVAAVWKATRPEKAVLLNGAAASETAFKAQAHGHRVLHLATHGFFAAAPNCGDSNNALLQSGLALAGANHRAAAAPTEDDGMLLAAEIANLDLTGVEWAVLSACDTGLGTIASGEGVFGLRRAFRVAGAATVIMTLWPVDDAATHEWIERLYNARFRSGASTAAAMRTATLGALEARRRANLSDHPFYWGGFVAAGDWR